MDYLNLNLKIRRATKCNKSTQLTSAMEGEGTVFNEDCTLYQPKADIFENIAIKKSQ